MSLLNISCHTNCYREHEITLHHTTGTYWLCLENLTSFFEKEDLDLWISKLNELKTLGEELPSDEFAPEDAELIDEDDLDAETEADEWYDQTYKSGEV